MQTGHSPVARHSANDADETALYAQQTVRIAIDELIKAWPDTPPLCSDFLYRDWQTVLLVTYRRFGRDSRQWHAAIQLAQDVLWLAQGATDTKSLERLPLLIPACCDELARLLKESGVKAEHWHDSLRVLRKEHGLLLQNRFQHHDPAASLPDAAANDDETSGSDGSAEQAGSLRR